jgi:sugar phosphate isomerase/epimerase
MRPPRRIRIGNQTSVAAANITQPFDHAVASGFDAFEWFPDWTDAGHGWQEKDLDRKARRSIRDAAARNDIALSVHIPWRLDLTHPEDFDRAVQSVRFARDIGADLMVVHFGDNQNREAYRLAIERLLQGHLGPAMRLAVENTPQTAPEELDALFAKLGALPGRGSRAGICLDIGHANLCPRTRNDYLGFIDMLDPEVPIIHVHLHENYGDADSHLTVFTGPSMADRSGIDGFVQRMKQRRFSGAIILEQWPRPATLLDRARKLLYQAFGDYAQGPP